MGSEKDIQAWIALEQTPEGNRGADIVVNPVLYAALVRHILASPRPVTLADFGGGTASLAFDILLRDPTSKPALANIGADLLKARKNIRTIVSIDMFDALLQRGEEQKRECGSQADAIHLVKVDIGSERLPFPDLELSIAVSRQFLIHLTRNELDHHFCEVYRVLEENGCYFASILNPARDFIRYQQKHPGASPLEPEQQYMYEMQHAGLRFSQVSTYRPLETYLHVAQEHGFAVEVEYLSACIWGYEKSHPSYYDKKLPMAVLLHMRKQ